MRRLPQLACPSNDAARLCRVPWSPFSPHVPPALVVTIAPKGSIEHGYKNCNSGPCSEYGVTSVVDREAMKIALMCETMHAYAAGQGNISRLLITLMALIANRLIVTHERWAPIACVLRWPYCLGTQLRDATTPPTG